MIQQCLWKALVLLYFIALTLAVFAAAVLLPLYGLEATVLPSRIALAMTAAIWCAAMSLLIKESYDEQAAR